MLLFTTYANAGPALKQHAEPNAHGRQFEATTVAKDNAE